MVEFMQSTFEQGYIPDGRFLHTGYLVQLQGGGYPFKGNDLSEDEWMWIGYFKNAREKISYEKVKK